MFISRLVTRWRSIYPLNYCSIILYHYCLAYAQAEFRKDRMNKKRNNKHSLIYLNNVQLISCGTVAIQINVSYLHENTLHSKSIWGQVA